MSSYEVALQTSAQMRERWEPIEAALRAAFAGAQFIDEGYSVDNPVEYTRAGVFGQLRPGLAFGHMLALDGDRVLGGFFCIPIERAPGETECDAGWIFLTPDTPSRLRAQILDALTTGAFAALRKAGFSRIVSNMGTIAGAKTLGRYGFVLEPAPEQPNRWVRDLTSP